MESVVLEDNITYVIVKELKINGNLYSLLANINDPTDICFRKTITENNEEYFVGLDDENELKLVMMHFSKDILK